jgi:hypothetical protein
VQPSPFPVASARPSTRSRRSAPAAAASARSTRSTTGTVLRATSRASGSRRAAVDLALRHLTTSVEAPTSRASPPGFTPARPAPRLARDELGVGELWLKLDTANPTHSLQGPRRRGRGAARRRSSASTTLLCSSTGQPRRCWSRRGRCRGHGGAVFVPADLEPEKLRPPAAYGPDESTRSTALRPLLAALGRALVRAPVGLRQRQPPLVLRGGLEDARRTSSPSSSGGGRPTSWRFRSPPERSSTRSAGLSPSSSALPSSTGRARARWDGQARAAARSRRRFPARRRRSEPCAARLDRAVTRRSATRRTATSRRDRGRGTGGASTPSPEDAGRRGTWRPRRGRRALFGRDGVRA